MSGVTVVPAAAVLAGQQAVAHLPVTTGAAGGAAGGAAAVIVHAAQATLPFTGAAVGSYLLVAVGLLLAGSIMRWRARDTDSS